MLLLHYACTWLASQPPAVCLPIPQQGHLLSTGGITTRPGRFMCCTPPCPSGWWCSPPVRLPPAAIRTHTRPMTVTGFLKRG